MAHRIVPPVFPAAHLREILHYDPDTGVFRWMVDIARRSRAGDEAGGLNAQGYRKIKIYGRVYACHRLAWAWMTGEWPEVLVDHRDGVKSNCRWLNLRLATEQVNAENRRAAHAGSVSGLLGVSFHRRAKKWRAGIESGGKFYHLGHHDTPELAHAAYVAAKRRLHAGCTI